MRDFTTVNNVLSELGRRNSIAGLRLGTASTIGLCLKDGVEVDFEYDSQRNRLYLYTAIHSIEEMKVCRGLHPIHKDKRKKMKMPVQINGQSAIRASTAAGSSTVKDEDKDHIVSETLQKIRESQAALLDGDQLAQHFLAALNRDAQWAPSFAERSPLKRINSLRSMADAGLSDSEWTRDGFEQGAEQGDTLGHQSRPRR